LALKIKTTAVNKTSFFLQGGFSAGFIINASEKRSPQVSGSKDKVTDISLMTNPTRINCLVGAGVDYLIGTKTTLFGMITYKNTLTNVANTTAYQVSRYTDPVQINPGSMEFSVGIMF
jgi:outer membrane protein W